MLLDRVALRVDDLEHHPAPGAAALLDRRRRRPRRRSGRRSACAGSGRSRAGGRSSPRASSPRARARRCARAPPRRRCRRARASCSMMSASSLSTLSSRISHGQREPLQHERAEDHAEDDEQDQRALVEARARRPWRAGSASAAASETAPRIPIQAMIATLRGVRDRVALAQAVEQPVREVGEDEGPHQPDHDHRRGRGAAVEDQLRRVEVLAAQVVEDRRQLQPDEDEQERVEQEDEDLPHRVALHAHGRVGQARGLRAHVEADRDGRGDAREAELLGRQVGGVAAHERDRDLDRRVVEALAHLRDHPADGEADARRRRGRSR